MQIIIYPLLFLLLYLNNKKKNLICIKVSSNGDSTLTRLSCSMINENLLEAFFDDNADEIFVNKCIDFYLS